MYIFFCFISVSQTEMWIANKLVHVPYSSLLTSFKMQYKVAELVLTNRTGKKAE